MSTVNWLLDLVTQAGGDSILSQSPKMTGKGQRVMCRGADGKCDDPFRCLDESWREAYC